MQPATFNAYNNSPYVQQQFQQPQQYQQNQQQSIKSNILWVQGIEGGKAYPVAPGNAVALWDSEQPYIYVKVADLSGVPQPLRKFHYVEEPIDNDAQTSKSGYITAEQLNTILDAKFAALTESLKKPYNKRHNGGKENGQ